MNECPPTKHDCEGQEKRENAKTKFEKKQFEEFTM